MLASARLGDGARAALVMVALLAGAATAHAEIFIRWTEARVPSRDSLGIDRLVVPASRPETVREAMRQGYRVYLEVDDTATVKMKAPTGVAGVIVAGSVPEARRQALGRQLGVGGTRLLVTESRGKWPHIRSNWVTSKGEVLQVTGRSAQPWLENNAALLRMARPEAGQAHPLLTYSWQPITLSDNDQGPALENYLVAIAEAGSFGGHLLLPLHERLQQRLLLGQPEARRDWGVIRRHMEFYSWDLAARYEPVANIGVVTADAAAHFEVMNLLARHNLPFELIPSAALASHDLSALALLIVLDRPGAPAIKVLNAFAAGGGRVMIGGPGAPSGLAGSSDRPWQQTAGLRTKERTTYEVGTGRVVELDLAVTDPNVFALDVRQVLDRERRTIDIWNGITVLTASYREPGGASLLVPVVNYAHQRLPVQLRVRGRFTVVHYESPEEPMTLVPYEHRDGYTEVVLPALTIGGRLFFSQPRE